MVSLKLPARMSRLSNEELFELCVANSDLVIERNSNGELRIMSPAGGLTGNRNALLTFELTRWNKEARLGYVFDSSTGFLLTDGSMLSPDVAWVARDSWHRLSQSQQEQFPPICPDFVVELVSPSDQAAHVEAKMQTWLENGCRLAWAVAPAERVTGVYRKDRAPEKISFSNPLHGGEVLPGFTLTISEIF
jgi:Uma2 family endonuclease